MKKRPWKKYRLRIGIIAAVVLMGTGFAFDIAGTHPSIFSLMHDIRHAPLVVDHGNAFHTYVPALMNFIAPGSINTVADTLNALGIPLTVRQARIVPLCKTLDQLSGPIIVQPDPYQYGVASWYGPGFQGQLAASGEMYNMYDLTAAHKTLPLQSQVRVVSQHTGNSVVVRINDRGPYAGGRIIDLSYQAKSVLGMDDLSAVYLERLDPTALDSCK